MASKTAPGSHVPVSVLRVQTQTDHFRLETILQYSFADKALLTRALTHTSAISPGKRVAQSYQRLEFLGDRVLGLVVADLLFKQFPGAKEGELARALNSVVRKEACAAVALDLGLGAFVFMDKSELRNGGREKPSVLADVCEAIIGSIYLDGGLDEAYNFIKRTYATQLAATSSPQVDAKTMLQEWAQGRGLPTPQYTENGRTGPAHNPIFTIGVSVQGYDQAEAMGPSKKIAEQTVAEMFLDREGIEEAK